MPSNILYKDDLMERKYGILEGIPKKWVKSIVGQRKLSSWKRGLSSSPPFGESFGELINRVAPTAKELQKLPIDKTTLVCCHSNSLRALLYKMSITDLETAQTFKVGNCVPIFVDKSRNGELVLRNKLK